MEFRQAPGGRGTEVLMTLTWETKGVVTQILRPLVGKAAWHGSETLRRAKQLIETGELSTAALTKTSAD